MSVLTGGIYAKETTDRFGWGAVLGPGGSVASVSGPIIAVSAVAPEGVVSGNPGSLCIVNDPSGASLWLKQTGSGSSGWAQLTPGGGSGSGNLDVLQAFIDHTSASVIMLGTLNPGDVVEGMELDVYTPFDDPAASITIGTATDPVAYSTALPLTPQSIQTSNGGIVISGTETAKIYLSLGGSTTGTARIALPIRRN
jgi:hypothetical protein